MVKGNYLDWYGLEKELLKRESAMKTVRGLVNCEEWCCERENHPLE